VRAILIDEAENQKLSHTEIGAGIGKSGNSIDKLKRTLPPSQNGDDQRRSVAEKVAWDGWQVRLPRRGATPPKEGTRPGQKRTVLSGARPAVQPVFRLAGDARKIGERFLLPWQHVDAYKQMQSQKGSRAS
jgi:hypothetical protein